MLNTFLTLKDVRDQRDQLHLPGIPLPYTQPHWLFSSVFRLCNQNSTLRNGDVTKMQAFLFACILGAVTEKQTGRSRKLLLCSVNRSPGSGWTNCGGRRCRTKVRSLPAALQRHLELAAPLLWVREAETERISAASDTQAFGSQATSPPFLLRISSFYNSSQTSEQRRRVSSWSSCIYYKNHILPESKVKSMGRQTDRKENISGSLILMNRHGQKHF